MKKSSIQSIVGGRSSDFFGFWVKNRRISLMLVVLIL